MTNRTAVSIATEAHFERNGPMAEATLHEPSRCSGSDTLLRYHGSVPGKKMTDQANAFRLRKHADYQRVYREGRKQFSSSMSYFFAVREPGCLIPGPRVGLTAGKVLGKAVERNRIKRRMRDIIRRRVALVSANVDIVLHPRRSVLTADFAKLESEVARIFSMIQVAIVKHVSDGPRAEPIPSKAQA